MVMRCMPERVEPQFIHLSPPADLAQQQLDPAEHDFLIGTGAAVVDVEGQCEQRHIQPEEPAHRPCPEHHERQGRKHGHQRDQGDEQQGSLPPQRAVGRERGDEDRGFGWRKTALRAIEKRRHARVPG